MVFGDWINGIKRRLGFFSFRRVLEEFLGKELDLSQLTDLSLREGVGELASLELSENGSFGSIFEKSPFVMQNGYIDKLRICRKSEEGKGPLISIEGVVVTLMYRGQRDENADNAQETVPAARFAKHATGTQELFEDEQESNNGHAGDEQEEEDDFDSWGTIGEMTSSLDSVLQAISVDIQQLTLRICFPKPGRADEHIEFLVHVPRAEVHDNSYQAANMSSRPATYQKLLKFRSIFVQLFEGSQASLETADALQDHSKCLLATDHTFLNCVTISYPASPTSQEPLSIKIVVAALHAILNPSQLRLLRECTAIMMTPRQTTPASPVEPVSSTATGVVSPVVFSLNVTSMQCYLLYQETQAVKHVWSEYIDAMLRSTDECEPSAENGVSPPEDPSRKGQFLSRSAFHLLGDHLHLVLEEVEMQQEPSMAERSHASAGDESCAAFKISVSFDMRLSERTFSSPAPNGGDRQLKELLSFPVVASAPRRHFTFRSVSIPKYEANFGELYTEQMCEITLRPMQLHVDADTLERAVRLFSRVAHDPFLPELPAAVTADDGHDRGVVHCISEYKVRFISLGVSVAFSVPRVERAAGTHPMLHLLAHRAGGAQPSVSAQLEDVSWDCKYTTVTTEDGMLCSPESDAAFRWNVAAESASVLLQDANRGRPRPLFWTQPPGPAAPHFVTGHVTFRTTPGDLGPETRDRYTTQSPLEEVSARHQRVFERAGVAWHLNVPYLGGRLSKADFHLFQWALAELCGLAPPTAPGDRPSEPVPSTVSCMDLTIDVLHLVTDCPPPVPPAKPEAAPDPGRSTPPKPDDRPSSGPNTPSPSHAQAAASASPSSASSSNGSAPPPAAAPATLEVRTPGNSSFSDFVSENHLKTEEAGGTDSVLFYSACSLAESGIMPHKVVTPTDTFDPSTPDPAAPGGPQTYRWAFHGGHVFVASHSADDGLTQTCVHAQSYELHQQCTRAPSYVPVMRCIPTASPKPEDAAVFRCYFHGGRHTDVLLARPVLNHYPAVPGDGWVARTADFFDGTAVDCDVSACPQRVRSGDPPQSPVSEASDEAFGGPPRVCEVSFMLRDAVAVYQPLEGASQAVLLLRSAVCSSNVVTPCPTSRVAVVLGEATLLLHDAFHYDVVAYGQGLGRSRMGLQAELAEMGFVQVASTSSVNLDVVNGGQAGVEKRVAVSVGDAEVVVDVCADSWQLLVAMAGRFAGDGDLLALHGQLPEAAEAAGGAAPAAAPDASHGSVTAAILTENPVFLGPGDAPAAGPGPSPGRGVPGSGSGSGGSADHQLDRAFRPPAPAPQDSGWASTAPKIIDCYIPSDHSAGAPSRTSAGAQTLDCGTVSPPLSPSVRVERLEGVSWGGGAGTSRGADDSEELVDIMIDNDEEFTIAYVNADAAAAPAAEPEGQYPRASLRCPIRLIEDYVDAMAARDSNKAAQTFVSSFTENLTQPSPEVVKVHIDNVTLTLKCFGGVDFSRTAPNLKMPLPGATNCRHPYAAAPSDSAEGGQEAPPLPCNARDSRQLVQIVGKRLDLQMAVFEEAASLAWRTLLAAEDILVQDRVAQSARHVLFGRWCDGGNMFTLLWDGVRPDVARVHRIEHRLKVGLIPVLINVDQDTAEFICSFFAGAGSAPARAPAPAPAAADSEPPLYIQHFSISPVEITLSYKPKHIDFVSLRKGRYYEMLNFCSLQGSKISLPQADVSGCRGLDQVVERLLDVWLPVIGKTEFLMFLCGLQPIRTLSKVGDSVAGLALTPLAHWHRDGTVFRGIAAALQTCLATVAIESMDLTATVSAGTQTLLERTASAFAPPPEAGKARSKYAAQPATAAEGFSQAYSALARGLKTAAQAVGGIPDVAPRSGYVAAGLQAVPVVLLTPMIGLTEAVSKSLWGVRNSMDPQHKVEMDRIYKGPGPDSK